MSGKIIDTNKVNMSGKIVSDFMFSHKVFGERFYIFDLRINRMSDAFDTIPVIVSERLLDGCLDRKGSYAYINGQFRSFNKHEQNRNKLILSVFAREFELLDGKCNTNHIFLDGYICKKPDYRETPLGREITDVLLAVNRPYGKSDYIPCICWGRNAIFVSGLEVGTHIAIEGRIQSREYQKRISDTEIETRTAYEVSANKINVIEETEDNTDAKEN